MENKTHEKKSKCLFNKMLSIANNVITVSPENLELFAVCPHRTDDFWTKRFQHSILRGVIILVTFLNMSMKHINSSSAERWRTRQTFQEILESHRLFKRVKVEPLVEPQKLFIKFRELRLIFFFEFLLFVLHTSVFFLLPRI